MNTHSSLRNASVPLMKDGKPLYCAIVAVRQPGGKVKTEEVFAHASSVGEARWHIGNSLDHRREYIVGVGPAVGVHCDDNGENLIL